MKAIRDTLAVIIPSLHGRVDALLVALEQQTVQPQQVEVVRGVQPNGRARNIGVARVSADWLVFIDDDALPGHPELLERLVATLQADRTIGVAGSAKLLPPDANWFQRWVAREVPRIVHPMTQEALETNPEPANHFYCAVTTTCCAMSRQTFAASGGFDERLVRGVDTEFFVRLRRRGYRLFLAAQTWVYHPAPSTLSELLRKQFLYGLGHAQEVRYDPSRDPRRAFHSRWQAGSYLAFRLAILLPNIFLPYSYADPRLRPGFKPLKALASLASACGYVYGWYRAP